MPSLYSGSHGSDHGDQYAHLDRGSPRPVGTARFRAVGHLITFTLRLNNLLRNSPGLPGRRSHQIPQTQGSAISYEREEPMPTSTTSSIPLSTQRSGIQTRRTLEEMNRVIVTEQLRHSHNELIEHGEIDLDEDSWSTYRGIVANLCVFLLVLLTVSIVLFYMAGWFVLIFHGSDPCDQPLGSWLMGMLFFNGIAAFFGQQVRHLVYRIFWGWQPPGEHSTEDIPICMRTTLDALHFIVVLAICFSGLFLLTKSQTCSQTAPVLYKWIYIWIHVMLFLIALRATLTLCGVAIITVMIAGGIWKTNDAADPDIISKIDIVTYEEGGIVHGAGEKGEDTVVGGQAMECSICFEKYKEAEELKFTPCRHLFHEECLKNWLKVKRTCPLCRLDLQEAFNPSADKENAAESAARSSQEEVSGMV